jgi:hypothetical protein
MWCKLAGMRTALTTVLLAASLAFGFACSDDSKEDIGPGLDASGQIADGGSLVDAQPSVDAMPQPLPDAMPQAAALGDLCGQDAEGLTCGEGLACCYPCGIQGCEFTCTQACDDNQPGCFNSCFLLP